MTKHRRTTLLTLAILVAALAGLAQIVPQVQALTANEAPEAHAGHDHDHDTDAHTEGQAEDDGHDHAAHTEAIRLTDAQLEQMAVQTAVAAAGALTTGVTLHGEIRLNADRTAHIVPRIRGVVREVRAQLGDHVRAGQVLALIESRELAVAKAEYLAALQRQALAHETYQREKTLYEAKVSAEADFLTARQHKAERDIEVTAARQKLMTLGLDSAKIEALTSVQEDDLRVYTLTAPYDGTLIDKHIVQGEVVDDQNAVFMLADLTTVWVDLNAYQRDVPKLAVGQAVTITGDGLLPTEATVSYVAPVLREATRTLLVRAVLPNPDNRYRPGLFVSGRVTVDDEPAGVVVPTEAVLNVDGTDSVFVQDDDGFEAVPVRVGRSDGRSVEILSGLEPGQRYVARGAFALKAVKVTSSLEGHVGHGH